MNADISEWKEKNEEKKRILHVGPQADTATINFGFLILFHLWLCIYKSLGVTKPKVTLRVTTVSSSFTGMMRK
jgi:hypothetical protein